MERLDPTKYAYGRRGELMVEGLSRLLYRRNPAMSLSFVPEQKCFHITGFPDMDGLECDEMLAQVESQYRHWRFREKTDQGIIIIELVGPTLAQINPAQLNPAQLSASGSVRHTRQRQRDIAQDIDQRDHDFRQKLASQRTVDSIRSKMQRIQSNSTTQRTLPQPTLN